jgi:hypothetical protein
MKSFGSKLFGSKLFGSKSLGSVGFVAVLAFYVAWPLYAGYQIKTALDAGDAPGLTAHVDFDSVRASLRPAVAAKVDKVVGDALSKAGTAGGVLADRLKAQIMPRIVDGVLAALVTPEMLIRIHASGTSLKDALDGLVLDRASKSEGLGGFMVTPAGQDGARSKLQDIAGKLGIDTGKALGGLSGKTAPAPAAEPKAALPVKSAQRPRYGLANIKQFSLDGPLGLTVGVARDGAATKPDLTAGMTFTGGGWKLTALTPAT